MNTVKLYTNFILSYFKNDFYYSLLIIVCVTFSTLSVVTLKQVSDSFVNAIDLSPAVANGGDILIIPKNIPLTEARLQELAHNGVSAIDRQVQLKSPGFIASGTKVNYVYSARGIDTKTYPLLGQFVLASGRNLKDVQIGGQKALLTEDLAYKLQVAKGDKFKLFGLTGSPAIELELEDIVIDNQNHSGGAVYLNLQTAQKLFNLNDSYNRVALKLTEPERVEEFAAQISAAGFESQMASEVSLPTSDQANGLRLFFNGVGIFGMLIGALGTMNTLRVLAARRVKDIAIFKTLGYSTWKILRLFSAELFLLSLIGALVGLGAGVNLSQLLIALLRRSANALLQSQLDPQSLLLAFVYSIVTSVVLALVVYYPTATTSPIVVLRGGAVRVSKRSRLFIYGLCFILLGIATTILVSSLAGFLVLAIVLVATAIIASIGRITIALFSLLLGLLPLQDKLPIINLKQRSTGQGFSMVSIFIGCLTLGLMLSISGATQVTVENQKPQELIAANINKAHLYTNGDIVLENLAGASKIDLVSHVTVNSEKFNLYRGIEGLLEGRGGDNFKGGLELLGSDWGTIKNGVYLPYWHAPLNFLLATGDARFANYANDKSWDKNAILIGENLTININGIDRQVTVAGYYWINRRVSPEFPENYPDSLITDLRNFKLLNPGNDYSTHVISDRDFGNDILEGLTNNAVATSVNQLQGANASTANTLAIFSGIIALIILASGIVLVIDTIALAVVQRAKEIALLRAIGYSARRLRWDLVLEFAFSSLVAVGLTALALPTIIVLINRATQLNPELLVNPNSIIICLVVSLVITWLTIVIAGKRALSVDPISILRSE